MLRRSAIKENWWKTFQNTEECGIISLCSSGLHRENCSVLPAFLKNINNVQLAKYKKIFKPNISKAPAYILLQKKSLSPLPELQCLLALITSGGIIRAVMQLLWRTISTFSVESFHKRKAFLRGVVFIKAQCVRTWAQNTHLPPGRQ